MFNSDVKEFYLDCIPYHIMHDNMTIKWNSTCGLTFIFNWMLQDPHPEYNLFGTIVHSGFSPDSGHYYAYIKVLSNSFVLNCVFFSCLVHIK